MVFVHYNLFEGIVFSLENLFRSLGVATTGGALADASLSLFRWGLCFPFSSFYFLVVCICDA